jgi:hypothetical protein
LLKTFLEKNKKFINNVGVIKKIVLHFFAKLFLF